MHRNLAHHGPSWFTFGVSAVYILLLFTTILNIAADSDRRRSSHTTSLILTVAAGIPVAFRLVPGPAWRLGATGRERLNIGEEMRALYDIGLVVGAATLFLSVAFVVNLVVEGENIGERRDMEATIESLSQSIKEKKSE